MEKIFIKYTMITYTYGTLRTIAYAPPLKKEEYVTDRIGRIFMHTISAPFMAPGYLFTDLRNIEHVVRKMPGSIDHSPW
jgi:hypothetical protein